MIGLEEPHDSVCTHPEFSQRVTAYCFGDATEQERDLFEAHLLECDFCWAEVRRLDRVIAALRSERKTPTAEVLPDIISMVGLSGRLERWFGGHCVHALASSAIYALLFSLSFVVEIAYQFERFKPLASLVSVPVFLWIFGTTLIALAINWKANLHGYRQGFLYSLGVAVVSVVILYLVIGPQLPNFPVTETTLQAQTAQAAYLKDVSIYCLPFGTIYLLLPYSFILAMQRELREGRHSMASKVLTAEDHAVVPRGSIFVRVWLLCSVLVVGAAGSLLATFYLFDHLKLTGQTGLFMKLMELKWAFFLILGSECLWWYQTALGELKRECLAVQWIAEKAKS